MLLRSLFRPLALLLMLVGATSALAAPLPEYRLSSVLDAAFPWGQAAERWAQLIQERSQGRIKVRVYSGASLVGGDQTREFTALQEGGIDLAVASTINWSPQMPVLHLFSMPFLIPDHKAFDALIQGEVGKRMFERLELNGVVPLAWGENGFRELSNSRRVIDSPAAFKGMKFRVVGSQLSVDTFTALGARPMQMSWVDAQPALAAGVVDGQENPLSVYQASNMPALGQKYLTLWHYIADPLVFAVSRRVWQTWGPAERQIVRAAAQQAARENLEKAHAQGGLDANVRRQLEAAGVVVTSLTPAQRAAFVQATRGVYRQWREIIGPALVDQAERAIAASQ